MELSNGENGQSSSRCQLIDNTYDLFFRVFIRWQQVDRFHVAEVYVMAQQKYE